VPRGSSFARSPFDEVATGASRNIDPIASGEQTCSFAQDRRITTEREMPDQDRVIQPTATVEQRVGAIQSALDARGMNATEAVEELDHLAQEEWIPKNGARVVARAWVDPAFRKRLLADGRAAVAELGLSMPKHHRHLVVLENTATVQNVICCTLCSCTAFTIIGLPRTGTRTSSTGRESFASLVPF
jgi:hypothetical protein